MSRLTRLTRPAGSPAAGPRGAIETLFVANRGEIAARIRRTGDRLGSAHDRPGRPTARTRLDLLDGPAVVAAAVAAGADAVHPGFGFLAESADFAEAVIAAGLVWVGPPPAAIRAMGDKAAARRLAADLGVPDPGRLRRRRTSRTPRCSPRPNGSACRSSSSRRPAAAARACARCATLTRLADDLAAARREARAAFGDDRLILERLVEGARHVEIQVLFDAPRRRASTSASATARSSAATRRSSRRRPSPAVDADAARAARRPPRWPWPARSATSAPGRASSSSTSAGAFTFLEMNTRLQVEHPVTEAITGRDLVADQLRIAAGEPLGIDQATVRANGHAVEVRLYAEDAEAGFLPATGRIERAALAERRGHPGRRRGRRGRRGDEPVRPDAGQDHRPRTRPRDGAGRA